MRTLASSLAVLALTLAAALAPGRALAQDSAAELEAPALALAPSAADADELASIDAEATAATVLYVGGVVLHVGGLAGAIGLGLGTICISFGGSCPDYSTGIAALFGVSGLGLAMIATGIGLDVDSGVRRRRLAQRSELSWGIAPTEGGAALSLSGSF